MSKFRIWSMLMCRIFYESCENLPLEATSRVSKNFSRRQIKNPLLTKVAHCSGDEKRYIQHGHRINIGLYNHKKLKKKQKPLIECPFEIIGFKCWPKYFFRKVHIKSYKKLIYSFFIALVLFSQSLKVCLSLLTHPLLNLTFKH